MSDTIGGAAQCRRYGSALPRVGGKRDADIVYSLSVKADALAAEYEKNRKALADFMSVLKQDQQEVA